MLAGMPEGTPGAPVSVPSSVAVGISDPVAPPPISVEQEAKEPSGGGEEPGDAAVEQELAPPMGETTMKPEATAFEVARTPGDSRIRELERKARFSLTRSFSLLLQGIEKFFPYVRALLTSFPFKKRLVFRQFFFAAETRGGVPAYATTGLQRQRE